MSTPGPHWRASGPNRFAGRSHDALILCLLLAALAVFVGQPAHASGSRDRPPVEADLQQRLIEEVERFGDHLNGVVLVARGDEVLVERAFGARDARTGKPNRTDTIFRIGSITKQLTAATTLALAEEGLVDLQAPLREYLPEYSDRIPTRDGAEIRIEHLLRHTSGVARMEELPELRRRLWSKTFSREMFLDGVMERPLSSVPGEVYRYNNSGYMLLGEVVRRATGGSFEGALRSRILDPLGMRDTGIVTTTVQRDRTARGRYPLGPWWVDSIEAFRLVELHLDDLRTSGAAFSTARDLWRWAQVFIDPDTGPLDPSSVAAMTTPGLDDYGFGVVVKGEEPWRRVWHNGAISPLGYSSELIAFPEQGLVVVVLSNDEYTLGTARRLRKNLVALLQGEHPPEIPAPTALKRLEALGLGTLLLLVRGALRPVVPLALLTWFAASGLRRARRSRLHWLPGPLVATGFSSLGLGILFQGSGSEPLIWASSALLAVLAGLFATRATRGITWAHQTWWRHALDVGLSMAALLFVAIKLDPTSLPRLVLVLVGLGAGLVLAAREKLDDPAAGSR